MNFHRFLSLAYLACALTTFSIAQTAPSGADENAVKMLMSQAAANWNAGDLERFATLYKRSDDIIIVGPKNRIGYAEMLKMYNANYPNAAARGLLTFSELNVKVLNPRFATLTGHFHLERSKESGGNQDGYYLLILEKTEIGWKAIVDDSTLLSSGAVKG